MILPQIVDTETLAKYFKKTVRTIQLWAKDKGMPKEGHNEYDLPKVVQWYLLWLEEKIAEYEKGDETLYKEKREEHRLKNEERRIKLERMRNKLIDLDAAKLAWTNETTLFRKNADSLKANLETCLIGIVPDDKKDEAREEIRKEINKYLNTLGTLKIDVEEHEELFSEEEDLE